jgi:mono/diheme cytochrome c family protein
MAPPFIRARSTCEERPRLPENESFYIIEHGVRRTAMPSWGTIMADSEIWQVVDFLNPLDNLPPSVVQELHSPVGSTP